MPPINPTSVSPPIMAAAAVLGGAHQHQVEVEIVLAKDARFTGDPGQGLRDREGRVNADELVGGAGAVKWPDDNEETKNGDSLDSHRPGLPSLIPDSARLLFRSVKVNLSAVMSRATRSVSRKGAKAAKGRMLSLRPQGEIFFKPLAIVRNDRRPAVTFASLRLGEKIPLPGRITRLEPPWNCRRLSNMMRRLELVGWCAVRKIRLFPLGFTVVLACGCDAPPRRSASTSARRRRAAACSACGRRRSKGCSPSRASTRS